ncbi:MAG: hypothetical protein AAF734_06760 [Bacteroidota bacterium]
MQFVVKVKNIKTGKTTSLTRFKTYAEAYEFYLFLNKTTFFEPCCVRLMTSEYRVISTFDSVSPDELNNF